MAHNQVTYVSRALPSYTTAATAAMIITGGNRTGIRWCVVGAEAKIRIKVRPPPRDNASVSSSAGRYLRNGVMVRERALFPRLCLARRAGELWEISPI